MKPSPDTTQVPKEQVNARSVDRKRKRSEKQGRTSSGEVTAAQQKTISTLFSAHSKPSVTAPTTSPSSKRSKIAPLNGDSETSPLVKISGALAVGNMYTFASKTVDAQVVDLTQSPQRSGQPRRMSTLKPLRINHNPAAGPRKLTVKNLNTQREPAKEVEAYFDRVCDQLDKALEDIFANPQAAVPIESLYQGVETLCRQGKASAINTLLTGKCEDHVQGLAKTLLERVYDDNITVLREVIQAWTVWKSQMTLLRCIFYFMDRSYLLQSSKPSLNDNCINIFRRLVFSHESLEPKIVDGACDLIAADRDQRSADNTTLRHAITMFHDLSTYNSSFEPRILEASGYFIKDWAVRTSEEKEVTEYVTAAAQLIQAETDRCELLNLESTTRRGLLKLLEEHVVQQKVEYLAAPAPLAKMLSDNDVDSLGRLYSLLDRKGLGAKLKAPFAAWVEETGTSIIFDDKASEEMVVRLLSLKRRLDAIWREPFQRSDELGHGLREAFEIFINKTKKGESTWGTDNSKTGEMIAKYVDMLLRGGVKAIPAVLSATNRDAAGNEPEEEDEGAVDEDTEVNAQLDQVLDLFRFVHGKAVFEAFYKKDLAKRLLMGRSASADAERSMLSRLKTECGAGFTQNLEQMFRDVELARDEMSSYKDRLEERDEKPALDLSVSILSAAAWPTYADVPVIIPADVNSAIESFERYYKSKHSGRKLAWKHALAHCQMKASFPKAAKEFVVSSFQAIVLLLFNGLGKDEHLTYEFIKTESGLPEAEIKRTLQSLACAKLQPLTKHPKGREINATDTFTVNLGFSHPKYRVRINQVQLKETKQENKETHERVAEDRNFECQAAVVRIMKSRKTIGHSELVAEVIKATRSRGVLGVADIKKNIERLIEKDYMEREEGNTYSYVA